MRDKVESVLGKIHADLRTDGTDLELVDIHDGIVKIKLNTCCPSSKVAAKRRIEQTLRDPIAEIKEVVIV